MGFFLWMFGVMVCDVFQHMAAMHYTLVAIQTDVCVCASGWVISHTGARHCDIILFEPIQDQSRNPCAKYLGEGSLLKEKSLQGGCQ